MPIQIGIGFSQDRDTTIAALEASQQAKQQLNRDRIDCAFVFNTLHYDPKEFLPIIYDSLYNTKIIGCSTAGIILTERIETCGIGILALHSDHIKFETGYVTHLDLRDCRMAGKTLAKSSLTDFGKQHRKLFLYFINSQSNPILNLSQGIKDILGEDFPVVGAGSSDDFQFEKSFQYHHNQIITNGAVCALLGGQLDIGMACQHGWHPLGKPRYIDQIEGPVIKSIDGKKALNIYEEYFPKEASTLKASSFGQINIHYPLGLRINDTDQYILRNVRRVLDEGGIVCQDSVKMNSEVHIMIGNKDSCLNAAENATVEVREQLNHKRPHLVLIFESLLRYKILGRSAIKEIQFIKDVLGYPIPIFGMYSHGEIFTYKSPEIKNETHLQNGSIIVIAIY